MGKSKERRAVAAILTSEVGKATRGFGALMGG
jgi:hypothetical protein